MSEARQATRLPLGGNGPRYSEMSDEGSNFHLEREQRDPLVVARFTVEGEPSAKARPRVGKNGNTYTPEKTKRGEEAIAWAFKASESGRQWTGVNAEDRYGVSVIFFYVHRQRRDIDNMVKAILDGLNGIVWADDVQVMELTARKDVPLEGPPRTEVVIYRLQRKETPAETPCKRCGKEFRTYRSIGSVYCSRECHYADKRGHDDGADKTCEQCGSTYRNSHESKYCSIECGSVARRVELECDHCGEMFTRQRCHKRKKNYCSSTCRDAAAAGRRTKAAKGTCSVCGGPVSKKTYNRCLACLRKGTTVQGVRRT